MLHQAIIKIIPFLLFTAPKESDKRLDEILPVFGNLQKACDFAQVVAQFFHNRMDGRPGTFPIVSRNPLVSRLLAHFGSL